MVKGIDQGSLGRRIGRYAEVSGRMGGLAAKAAGGRLLGRANDRAERAVELRRALGALKGPVMKVAQLLATIPEALPREYAAELVQLQSQAPSMGRAFVQRRMAAELGPDWQAKFSAFEPEAAAAASLGQVHLARDGRGQSLACKLQYPDMASVVEADLRQLGLAFAIHRRFDKSVETRNVLAEIGARLREELDYDLEARHMRLYRDLLHGEKGVHVPRVIGGLSTRRLLTMTWAEGRPLADFTDAAEDVRNTIARNLFRTWYLPLYGAGVIHGDPHMGNYTVRPDHSVNLLDFGCMRSFAPRFLQGVIDLYVATRDGDRALAEHAYRSWGFDHLTAPVIEALNLWAAFLYAPLLEDRPRLIQEFEQEGVYGRDVALEVHRRLGAEGGVIPPREWVFMDRAAVGLGGVFLRLEARLNWHREFHALIDGFDADRMTHRQREAFGRAGVPLP